MKIGKINQTRRDVDLSRLKNETSIYRVSKTRRRFIASQNKGARRDAIYRVLLSILFLSFFSIHVAYADTVYIASKTDVMMRDAPGEDGAILKELSNGVPVEQLKDDGTGYSLIQDVKGTQGWVLTDYLKSKQDENMFTHLLNNLRFWHHEPKQDLSPAVAKDISDSKPKAEEVISSPTGLKNVQLQQQMSGLTLQIQGLNERVQFLEKKQKTNSYEFIMGMLVGILGILVGFAIGASKRRRRDRWY